MLSRSLSLSSFLPLSSSFLSPYSSLSPLFLSPSPFSRSLSTPSGEKREKERERERGGSVLVRGGDVFTYTEEGVGVFKPQHDVLIEDGRIMSVGENASAKKWDINEFCFLLSSSHLIIHSYFLISIDSNLFSISEVWRKWTRQVSWSCLDSYAHTDISIACSRGRRSSLLEQEQIIGNHIHSLRLTKKRIRTSDNCQTYCNSGGCRLLLLRSLHIRFLMSSRVFGGR